MAIHGLSMMLALQLYMLSMRLKNGRTSKLRLTINPNFLRLSPKVLYFLPLKKKLINAIQYRFMYAIAMMKTS